ncbi:MAG: hypothetical protein HFJ10_04160 [Lachnospiraceae bacterium]|jgi:hypothetical protein|nr:hypothetical protein [Lachnospiraceae bacterium]
MKVKRILSTVVASALVAAQMAMPVMAADGGEVDVDVTTKTAVIRVQVPTTLAIAVNQFEKGDTGSQIYSGTFDITNKSEIPVKVSVTSKATLASTDPITLVPSKDAAEKSSEEEAWLAVAAQTSDGKYTEEAGKGVEILTEADDNVTTFVQGSDAAKSEATAAQTFYLAAETTPSVTYNKVAPTDADEVAEAQKISYAQFYELTSIATQPTDDATLQAEVDKADIYAIDGSDAVTFIEKGTANATFASGSTYYTAATAPTLSKDLAASKVYVYGEAGDGGKTGFRYVGKLSEAKETWTATDISNVNIKYDITGVTATKYAEAEKNCNYGLYAEGPQVTITSGGVITISGLTEETNPTDMNLIDVEDNNKAYNLTSQSSTWTATGSAAEGTIIVKLGKAWFGLAGKQVKIELDLKDGSKISGTTTLGDAPASN